MDKKPGIKREEDLPPIKRVKTDPENINLSRDEFIAKRLKAKELEARLAVESKRIEAELEAEGTKDNEISSEAPESIDAVQTVKKAGRPRKVVEEQV